MTPEIGIVLVVTCLALGLFVSERFPLAVTALLLLVTLVGLNLLGGLPAAARLGIDLEGAFPSPEQGLSGISSPATITVLCMFVLSAGEPRAGWIERLGRSLTRMVGRSALRQVVVLGLIVGPVSGLINNTAAVAMLLPLVIDLSKRTNVPAGKLLIPLSYFAMLGGTLTLVGTSTNILAAGLLVDLGGPRLGMFSFSAIGAIVLCVGMLYFCLIGIWILPRRRIKDGTEGDPRFLVELRIPEQSPLIGKSLEENAFLTAHGLELRRLLRGGSVVADTPETTKLSAGDVLMVEALQESVAKLLHDERVRLEYRATPGLRSELAGESVVARVLINTPFVARRKHLRELDLEAEHSATIVGLHRSAGEARRLGNLVIRTGQVVLLLLPRHALSRLRRSQNLVLLEHIEHPYDFSHARTSLAIVIGVVLVAALTPVPIVYAALTGVLAMFMTRCLSPEEAYRSVGWDIIVLLACVIPLGITVSKSGTADWLAALYSSWAGAWSPFWIVFGLYVVTTMLTEVVSNNAAVVVLVPVAMSVASQVGLEPVGLVLAVMFGASTSFLSPIGYQTNTMVHATGVYRFADFFRVGAPLNLLTALATAAAVTRFFPTTAV